MAGTAKVVGSLVTWIERSEIRVRLPGVAEFYHGGRPTGSGLWPARWQAPAGPVGSIRATIQEPPRLFHSGISLAALPPVVLGIHS
jgi:hypothetical protein